ncbi:hypothetical protein B6D29_00110 [Microgenomates bacterium UTCPR1]|nr:single-stranded DNA-binding protein [Patescibacteria group bacterium]OQY69182.1 MAG: hypothetical protein B6D29_00110 [Microgenomates bacterium UTCPR1]
MAARSLNQVFLIGNLTRDPELKYTPNGTAFCSFGIATNRSWVTNDGTTKEDVQYHKIVAWQKLAELCAKILSKGKKVFTEGRLTYRSYTGKDGQQRQSTEIVLEDFIVFGDGKKSAGDDLKPAKEDVDLKATETKKSEDIEVPPSENAEETVNPDDIPF